MGAAEMAAVIIESLVIIALIPVIAVSWRAEVKRRRVRRLIASVGTEMLRLQAVFVEIGRAAQAAAPAFDRLAAAIRSYGKQGGDL